MNTIIIFIYAYMAGIYASKFLEEIEFNNEEYVTSIFCLLFIFLYSIIWIIDFIIDLFNKIKQLCKSKLQVRTLYYYIINKKLTEEQIKNLKDWKIIKTKETGIFSKYHLWLCNKMLKNK